MKIRVERCSGGQKSYFQLTLPCGSREFVSNPHEGWWSRSHATDALNLLTRLYGVNRRSIRFDVV